MTTENTGAPAAPAAGAAPAAPANELPIEASAPPAAAPANPLEVPDPAAEAAAKAAAEAAKPAQVFTYTPSGDAALDLALDFVGGLGFGPDHAAIKAAEAGDFAPLTEALKGLGDKAKGFEKILEAGKAGFGRIDAANKERAGKTAAAIHEIVGGADQWGRIQAWAGQNATPEERSAVNAALKAGGLVAKAVARELNALYMRQPGAEKQGQPARTQANTVANTTPNVLSPKEYATEVRKLHQRMGGRMETSAEYRDLQARRAAYKGR